MTTSNDITPLHNADWNAPLPQIEATSVQEQSGDLPPSQVGLAQGDNTDGSSRRSLVLEIEFVGDAPSLRVTKMAWTNNASAASSVGQTTDSDAQDLNSALQMSTSFQPSPSLNLLKTEFHRIRKEFNTADRQAVTQKRLELLTSREFDVLLLMVRGYSCKEIALHFNVGFATAAKHQAKIRAKLNVRSTVELVHILSEMCPSEAEGE